MHGVEGLPRLQHFSAYICPKLESLSGLEAAVGLQHVDLQSCNRITDLSPLARLDALRSVQIEMRAPPSVATLSGHAALEFIRIVSAKQQAPEVIEAMLRSPRLRILATGRRWWLRTDGEWEHIPDIYGMTQIQRAMYGHLEDERNAIAAW
jgi:hypothetical protein